MTSVEAYHGAGALLRKFKGRIITANSADYGSARSVWNRDADRYPLAIAQPSDVEDVIAAVRFARDADLPTSVRCGGHSYQGHSTCDRGLVIDLSTAMGCVRLDQSCNLVRAEGGALLGAVDRATVPAGRVVPAGIVSHTGLGGLSLGGGIGYLSRSFGLTCDQFQRLQLVTAAGELVRVSESENPDLFWALRGGGGNFGIVTQFDLRTHPLGPVQAGPLIYSMDNAIDVLQAIEALMAEAPRELSLTIALAIKPRAIGLGDAFPATARLLSVYIVYRGHADEEIVTAVRTCRRPLFDLVKPSNFLTVQARLDKVSQHGVAWYMKSGHSQTLNAGLIERMVVSSMEYQRIASPEVEREVYSIQSLGGATSDLSEDATAYSGRKAQWHCAVEVGFKSREERERIVDWTKESWAKTQRFLDMRTSYVNMNFEESARALESVYGTEKLARLQRIKAVYDPDNFFRLNTNILPSSHLG